MIDFREVIQLKGKISVLTFCAAINEDEILKMITENFIYIREVFFLLFGKTE